MNINKLFLDKVFLEKQLNFYFKTNKIKKIENSLELSQSHLEKAKHNIKFYKLNKENSDYQDRQIVVLYYSLYQACLSLLTKKGYSSKSHEATILLLIKEYSISKNEAELIDNLELNRDEAQMYTQLKKDRHDASYSTGTRFTKEIIEKYEKDVIKFINKTELILKE
jgi:uncharacterized protein (UPF0332 family)